MSKSQSIRARPWLRVAPTQLSWRALLRGAAAELGLAIGLLAVIVSGTLWGYRQPVTYNLPLAQDDGLYKDGLGALEQGDSGWFRWSAPSMLIRFPNVGRADYQAQLEFHTPQTAAPRILSISAGRDQPPLATYALRPGWQRLVVTIPAQRIAAASGDLELVARVDPPLEGGGRKLGVAIRAITIRQLSVAAAPRDVQWLLVALAALVVLPLRLLGTPRRWAGLAGTMLLLLAVGWLGWWRIGTLLTLPPLINALTIALWALPLLWLWLRFQDAAARAWALGVAALALGVFAVRFAGMQHPQFVQIDHTLRVHQIEAIAAGQRAQVAAALSRQYEWGRDVAVPYSLLSYDLFVPLAGRLSTPQLLAVVEGVTVALDASVPLLLWSIARRNRSDARSSWWTAALFGVMPVGYLYFHDGSYPTIIGLWIAVVALWLLTILADRPRWWLWLAATSAIALAILMYVTQLAFVPALLGFAMLSAWTLGRGAVRRNARWIALAAVVGLALAFVGYYGAQLPTLLTKTIPAYVATLRAGGSVGRDATLLPGPLLGNTWQQLWGHYRVIGVALATVGVLLAMRRRERWTTHLVVGYGIFLILTALADLRFGLWNKQMYFALPGVALAAGPVFGHIERRGWSGRIAVWALWGYLVWTGLEAWALRVIWYVWSLQTL